MKIKENQWHAKLYYYSYNTLPKSLCRYFWMLLLSIVLLPITWCGYVVPKVRKDRGNNIGSFIGFTVGLFYVGSLLLPYLLGNAFSKLNELVDISDVQMLGIGYILLILMAAAIFLLLFLAFNVFPYLKEKLEERTKNKKPKQEKGPSIISEYYKAFMGKYCPRIDWEK